jgi:23S rRNA (uracil1939-C5)-methyltransferase
MRGSADIRLTIDKVVAGGDGLARADDGRVVFVAGALPGERVDAAVIDERKDFLRAEVVGVIDASAQRVTPPCPYVAAGCGGCGWQHISHGAQLGLKRAIVVESLQRIGRIPDAEGLVAAPAPLEPWSHRTSLRLAREPRGGRLGFHRAASSEVVPVEHCMVTHPVVGEMLAPDAVRTTPDAREVVLRGSVATGDRLVWAPRADVLTAPFGAGVGERASVVEHVSGAALRSSAAAFFQARPDGAAALVEEVARHVGAPGDGLLVDAYGGVGLFAATVGTDRRVVVVESSRAAVVDANHNLGPRLGNEVRVVRAEMARWTTDEDVDVVVADPARPGLGKAATAAIVSTGAAKIVLVSCDAGSLGRDARLLAEHGYVPQAATLVDLFPHTPHVEVVTSWQRTSDAEVIR